MIRKLALALSLLLAAAPTRADLLIDTMGDFPTTYSLAFSKADPDLVKYEYLGYWFETGLLLDHAASISKVGVLAAGCDPGEVEFCVAQSITLVVRPAGTTGCNYGSICPDMTVAPIATYLIPMDSYEWAYHEVEVEFSTDAAVYFLFRATGTGPWGASYLRTYDDMAVKGDTPSGRCSTLYGWSAGDEEMAIGVRVEGSASMK